MAGINSNKIALYYLPLLCQLLSMFNPVFAHYGLHRLYLYVYVISLVALFIVPRAPIYSSRNSSFFYLGGITVVLMFHLVCSPYPSLLLFSGFLTYFLPVFYWAIYCHKDCGYIFSVFHALKYPMAIMAVLAVVQYFYSPNLFGFYVGEEGTMMSWATDSSFETYSAFFRASSLLGSPQILGLTMALYLIVFLRFLWKNNFINYLFVVSFVIAGILSGSKSFFFLVGAYLLYRMLLSHAKIRTKIIIILGVGVAVIFLSRYSEIFGFVERLSNVDQIAEEERSGRLSIYKKIITEITVFGEGPGTAQTISGFVRKMNALESYIFQLLYELGLLAFLLFLAVLVEGFVKSKQKIMVALIAFSMVYVHAFNSFVFFIFWAFLFLPDITKKIGSTNIELKN